MSLRTVNAASYNGCGEFKRFLPAFKSDVKIFKWTEKDQAEVFEHQIEGKARKAIDNAKKKNINQIIEELREKCDISPEYFQFCQRTMRLGVTVSQNRYAVI